MVAVCFDVSVIALDAELVVVAVLVLEDELVVAVVFDVSALARDEELTFCCSQSYFLEPGVVSDVLLLVSGYIP